MPSPLWRATIRPPLPRTTRTLFVRGIVDVAGSSSTRAEPPSGRTATQTRFSLSESADTRAAYAAPRYFVFQPSGIFWSSNAEAS